MLRTRIPWPARERAGPHPVSINPEDCVTRCRSHDRTHRQHRGIGAAIGDDGDAVAEVECWIAERKQGWSDRLDRLDAYLDDTRNVAPATSTTTTTTEEQP